MDHLPEEFRQRMERMLGAEYGDFLASYERPRRGGLRLNALKQGSDRLPESGLFHLSPVAWAPGGFYYDPADRPGKHPFHECGVYYMQEPSAMAVAALSGVKPGMRVLDLCAAPGGKSTHLASMLGGEGLLVSNEIHPARAKILSQNIERMGIANAVVTNETPERLKDRFALFFDTVVVDAPCSGEGMFMKEPEAIPNWSPANVELCAERQLAILDRAAEMTAPGGTLVYSTCTFAPLEDERNCMVFLAEHPEFEIADLPAELGAPFMESTGVAAGVPEWACLTADGSEGPDGGMAGTNGSSPLRSLQGCIRLWPHRLEGEGHFVAVFRKRGETFATRIPAAQPLRDKEALRLLTEFCDEDLTEYGRKKLLAGEKVGAGLSLFGNELYRVPYSFDLKGLKVLRAGLHLGTLKKNRFEPSHSLALYLSARDAARSAETGCGNAASAYLRGESLQVPDCVHVTGEKGWCLITIGGFSAGWGKISSGQIKNHYPKGLRRAH